MICAIFDDYVTKDREAAEALIARDFRFTSPLDNGIDPDRDPPLPKFGTRSLRLELSPISSEITDRSNDPAI